MAEVDNRAPPNPTLIKEQAMDFLLMAAIAVEAVLIVITTTTGTGGDGGNDAVAS